MLNYNVSNILPPVFFSGRSGVRQQVAVWRHLLPEVRAGSVEAKSVASSKAWDIDVPNTSKVLR